MDESNDDPSESLGELDLTKHVPRAGELSRRRIAKVALDVLSGADVGARFEVKGPRIVAGRALEHDVCLRDSSVSKTHFELVLREHDVVLRDLGSHNGTWIDRARVLDRVALVDGAEFEAGSCKIRMRCEGTVQVPVSSQAEFENLRGESEQMRELFSLLAYIAPHKVTVLVHGETGTGKEEVARAIHASSRRGPFIVLDCAALPRELAEASILGCRKGAFTGATSDHAGCFEEADGGTLFLDEIGELPLELQPKLLRVLDRREVCRIQEHHPRRVDVRVICATHRNLREEIANGRFRLDLYNRIAHVGVEVAPLRERRGDIVLLAQHFLAGVAKELGRELSFSPEALERLSTCYWEGNVRQLKLVVERVGILARGSVITREEITLESPRVPPQSLSDESLRRLPLKEAEARTLAALQRSYCESVLAETAGNIAAAADRAGYSERGFRDLLKKLGLR